MKRPLVLAAVDHVTDVKRTMEVAVRTAKRRGADVHVIEVMPHKVVPVDDRTGRPWSAPLAEYGVGMGPRFASTAASAEHDGVRVRRVMLRGQPEHAIPAYAHLHEAAVLVVERDYGSSRLWRNGRVVDEIARRSPAPLLVLPQVTGGRDESSPRRILAAVDFSMASAVALRTALDLSRRQGARVTAVHAMNDVPPHSVFSGSEAWEVMRQLPAQANAVAERLRRTAAFFGADDVDTEVTTGTAHRAILEIARRMETDLIVMGVARRSWFDRALFGSTLRRVLRRATTPVLVIPVVAGAHTWPNEVVVDPVTDGRWTTSAVDPLAA